MEERVLGKDEVPGSIPGVGSKTKARNAERIGGLREAAITADA